MWLGQERSNRTFALGNLYQMKPGKLSETSVHSLSLSLSLSHSLSRLRKWEKTVSNSISTDIIFKPAFKKLALDAKCYILFCTASHLTFTPFIHVRWLKRGSSSCAVLSFEHFTCFVSSDQGFVLGVSKNIFREIFFIIDDRFFIQKDFWLLSPTDGPGRKWTEAWKCWSNPSSAGLAI